MTSRPRSCYDNDDVVAFRDLNPVAPTHVLVIPKRHIVGADHIAAGDGDVLAAMFLAAKAVADADGVDESGLPHGVQRRAPTPAKPCRICTCTSSAGGQCPGLPASVAADHVRFA